MMPELNGFQFLEELSHRGIHTPVVMMTGYSTVENAVKSMTTTGAVDYIPKPFTADEITHGNPAAASVASSCWTMLNRPASPAAMPWVTFPAPPITTSLDMSVGH